jgi:hypothetical protein
MFGSGGLSRLKKDSNGRVKVILREGGADCNLIVRMAYDCREAPILLKDIEATPSEPPPPLRVPEPFCITADVTCCNIVPFSVTPEWMD